MRVNTERGEKTGFKNILSGNLQKYLQAYTGDCCDRSTGANMLASAAYLTFLLAAPLLLLTTAHFIIGESWGG